MMRRSFALLAAASLTLPLLHAATGGPPSDSQLIVPGIHVGPIVGDTSEHDLVALYGREQVQPADLSLGEGQTVPGTILFPEDPTKTLEILWKQADRHGVREARIRREGTGWRTSKGVSIGTSLKEIERINGRPFVLMGFDWDYGGTILHGNGGALGELGRQEKGGILGRTLLLRLEPRGGPQNSPDYIKVKGSREFSSGHPSMQALNPVVYEMIVTFGGD
jgi:hypothetical protein